MTSLTGYSAELRALTPGGSVARVGRVPVAERARLNDFRSAVTAANARAEGRFTIQTLDAISDDFTHAVRVIVTTRMS